MTKRDEAVKQYNERKTTETENESKKLRKQVTEKLKIEKEMNGKKQLKPG